jgi:hypothetical protein
MKPVTEIARHPTVALFPAQKRMLQTIKHAINKAKSTKQSSKHKGTLMSRRRLECGGTLAVSQTLWQPK